MGNGAWALGMGNSFFFFLLTFSFFLLPSSFFLLPSLLILKIPTFVLASASPARRRLLENAGIQAVICPSDFDEGQIQMRDATNLVQVLAEGKAEAVAKFLLANSHAQIPNPKSCLVLGCDSILLIDGEIHGKPKDAEEAISRWQKMRGKMGELYTGHALIDTRFDDFDEARSRSLIR